VDAPGLAFGFGILTADDDAGMFRGLEVKSDEVTPVQSQHSSTQRREVAKASISASGMAFPD